MDTASRALRILVAGVDREGKSCVVSDGFSLEVNPLHSGFSHADLYQTDAASPTSRPFGYGDHLDTGLTQGLVRWQVIEYSPSLRYPMHHTDTIDFDTVLRGSIELVLDDGVHLLEVGEGAIVTGVDHAWNAGTDGCRLSVVSIGTPPPTR